MKKLLTLITLIPLLSLGSTGQALAQSDGGFNDPPMGPPIRISTPLQDNGDNIKWDFGGTMWLQGSDDTMPFSGSFLYNKQTGQAHSPNITVGQLTFTWVVSTQPDRIYFGTTTSDLTNTPSLSISIGPAFGSNAPHGTFDNPATYERFGSPVWNYANESGGALGGQSSDEKQEFFRDYGFYEAWFRDGFIHGAQYTPALPPLTSTPTPEGPKPISFKWFDAFQMLDIQIAQQENTEFWRDLAEMADFVGTAIESNFDVTGEVTDPQNIPVTRIAGAGANRQVDGVEVLKQVLENINAVDVEAPAQFTMEVLPNTFGFKSTAMNYLDAAASAVKEFSLALAGDPPDSNYMELIQTSGNSLNFGFAEAFNGDYTGLNADVVTFGTGLDKAFEALGLGLEGEERLLITLERLQGAVLAGDHQGADLQSAWAESILMELEAAFRLASSQFSLLAGLIAPIDAVFHDALAKMSELADSARPSQMFVDAIPEPGPVDNTPHPVPDTGSTLMLLSAALMALGGIRHKLSI